MSRHKLPTPEDPDGQGDVTARTVLLVLLRAIHTAGEQDKDVNPALLSNPDSATATAYRFGVHRMAFDLDDILFAAGNDRHLAESHEDNREMVGVA